MMELEEQQRREMIERQKEDMIRQSATSSEYTAQALRAMSPPKSNPQRLNMFEWHSGNSSRFQQAQ